MNRNSLLLLVDMLLLILSLITGAQHSQKDQDRAGECCRAKAVGWSGSQDVYECYMSRLGK